MWLSCRRRLTYPPTSNSPDEVSEHCGRPRKISVATSQAPHSLDLNLTDLQYNSLYCFLFCFVLISLQPVSLLRAPPHFVSPLSFPHQPSPDVFIFFFTLFYCTYDRYFNFLIWMLLKQSWLLIGCFKRIQFFFFFYYTRSAEYCFVYFFYY